MTITFENDNDVIVYALEKIISYARRTRQVFAAQCIWWLASLIGLEQGLVVHIDNLNGRTVDITESIPEQGHIPERRNATEEKDPVPGEAEVPRGVSAIPRDLDEDKRTDNILKECAEYLRDSRRLREIAARKTKGGTPTELFNRTAISTKHLRKKDRVDRKRSNLKPSLSKTEGIDEAEIQRRRRKGECLRCAWPSDRKGSHRVADCRRPIRLQIGTVLFPIKRGKQKSKPQQPVVEEDSTEETSGTGSSDDSL